MKKEQSTVPLKIIVSTIGIFIFTGVIGWFFTRRSRSRVGRTQPVKEFEASESVQSSLQLDAAPAAVELTGIGPAGVSGGTPRPIIAALIDKVLSLAPRQGINKRSFILYYLYLCFTLAIFGQWSLDSHYTGGGLILYALAGFCFIAALRHAGIPDPGFEIKLVQVIYRQPGLFFLPLFLLAFIVKNAAIQGPSPAENWSTLIMWLADILLFCSITLYMTGWRPPGLRDWLQWVNAHQLEFMGILVLTAAALSVRIISLSAIPFPPNNDDGQVGTMALYFLHNQVQNFFGIGWSSQPNLSFVLALPSIGLFQNTVFAIRLVSALEGALTVIALYFLARQEFGVRTGFLAAGLLVALPVHLQFSRLGVHNIIPAFFAVLSVWLVFRAFRTRRTSSYLWAGLSVGFAFYTYLGSRLAMILVFGILVYVALTHRRMLSLPGVLVFFGIVVIVVAPMATFFVHNPDQFMARMNGESIFLRDWLPVHSESTGMSIVQILWDQLKRSSLVFISGSAPAGFFNSSQPYFPMIAAWFLVLGMAYAVRKIWQPIYIAIFAWFWSAIIFGSAITVNAPSSQRLVMSVPAAALLAAIGIDLTLRAFEKDGLVSRRWGWVISILMICGCAAYGTIYYFGDYRTIDARGDYPNQAMIGGINNEIQLGPAYRFYLLARPTLSLEFGNFKYLLDGYDKKELVDSVTNLIGDYDRKRGALFMAMPEQLNNLKMVEMYIPGGKQTEYKNQDYPKQALYFTYVVPPVK